jgi:hypothetical protein
MDQDMDQEHTEEHTDRQERDFQVQKNVSRFHPQPLPPPSEYACLLYSYICTLLDDPSSPIHATKLKEFQYIFKFKIQPFISGFTDYVQEYSFDRLFILDLCYESRYLKRYTESNKKCKTKGFEVWVVEADRDGQDWVLKEYTSFLVVTKAIDGWYITVCDPHSVHDLFVHCPLLPKGLSIVGSKIIGHVENVEIELWCAYYSLYNGSKREKVLKQTVML